MRIRSFQTRFPSIHGPENATLLGATLSFFVLGAFFGCLANIWIGNKVGRRTVLIAGGLGTLVGGALQAGSVNLAMLMASRLINGFAVGQLTATVPPYVGTSKSADLVSDALTLRFSRIDKAPLPWYSHVHRARPCRDWTHVRLLGHLCFPQRDQRARLAHRKRDSPHLRHLN